MIERVAFFEGKQEVERFFGFSTSKENLFEPNYNIPRGWQIPVIIFDKDSEEPSIKKVSWGERTGKSSTKAVIEISELSEEKSQQGGTRCILPLSGFFVWKDADRGGHPFFVRMLNQPVMAVAGLYYQDGSECVSMIITDSNPLIQPMSAKMPLMLNREMSKKWLNLSFSIKEFLKEAGNLFLLTDLSVLRVSKKVNDTSYNSPELIQPIPK